MATRGSSTYYDRHRISKGDDEVVTSDEVTSTLPPETLGKIVSAAVAADSKYAFLATTDDLGRFLALKEFTRGINWIGNRGKTLRHLAASFTVEI